VAWQSGFGKVAGRDFGVGAHDSKIPSILYRLSRPLLAAAQATPAWRGASTVMFLKNMSYSTPSPHGMPHFVFADYLELAALLHVFFALPAQILP
jgi:hypothetical protein